MFKPFNSFSPQVVFQEVPDEVSLAFTISGCPLRCEGCHSYDTWDAAKGDALSIERFIGFLALYEDMITCVLFFGGEWHSEHLVALLKIAQSRGLKTCLYTGSDRVTKRISEHLTFLKTGCWQPALGGLASSTTNQRFIHVQSNQLLNFKFIGAQNAAL